ncbi:MAG: hypothetical protein LUH18_10745 [Oscillospiraceae bacterium]|nr:hypothetical protein [Oscillospiraceae bacterium]
MRVKNIFIMITVVVLGLSLCGCSMTSELSTDANMDFDQYGEGYPQIAEGDDAYYYADDENIRAYYTDTGETTVFCSGFGNIDYLGYYDGGVYTVSGNTLYSVSKNIKVKQFEIPEAENLSKKQYVMHSGWFILSGLSEDGNAEVLTYSLESGECETVYELAEADYVRLCPYSDILYILSGNSEITELCGYDLDSKETSILYSSGDCIFTDPFFRVTVEAAYMSEGGAVYIYDVTSGGISMSFDFNSDDTTAYEIGGIVEYYVFAGYSDENGYHLYVKDIYGNDKIVTDIALSEDIEAVICGNDSQRVFVRVNPGSSDGSVIAVNYLNGEFETLW